MESPNIGFWGIFCYSYNTEPLNSADNYSTFDDVSRGACHGFGPGAQRKGVGTGQGGETESDLACFF